MLYQGILYGIPSLILNVICMPIIFVMTFIDMVLSMFFWEEQGEKAEDFVLFLVSSPLILILATILTVLDCVALSMIHEDIVMFTSTIELKKL